MKTYPKINQLVSFVRADEKAEIHTGTGKVQAIFAHAPDRRLMVQVKTDDGSAYNIDLEMINASDDEVAAYTAAVAEVQSLTDEGNARVKDIVAEYNGRVQAVYTRVLGEPLDV